MFMTKYACITSFAKDGEFLSVRSCKGTKKALSLLEECVEEEKILLDIKPGDDAYQVELPTHAELTRLLKKHKKFILEGEHYVCVIAETYFI